MNKILVLSGKKQSGKTTTANFIVGLYLLKLGLVTKFRITDDGLLWINDLFGVSEDSGILDVSANDPELHKFLKDHLWEHVKIYSFADALKQKVCIEILGLTYQQCYGSDNDKNSLTRLKWEDMPGVIPLADGEIEENVIGRLGPYYTRSKGLICHAPGYMTAREVLQFVGTEIFRKMYGDVWVDATLNQIQKDNPNLAIIVDGRFPNEIYGAAARGAKSLRLGRTVFPNDKHSSEISLDPNVFDWNHFTWVLDNQNISVPEQNKEIYNILSRVDYLPKVIDDNDN